MGTGLEYVFGGAAMGLASRPGKIAAPPKRNYLREMQDALSAQMYIQPDLLAGEARITPAWQNLQKTTLMGQMGVMSDLFKYAAPRAAELGNLQMSTMSPLYARAGQEMTSLYDQALGPAAGLYNSMMAQAQQELALGRNLSPEESAMANQTARAAYAARGITQGNPAIAAEVLSNNMLATQREASRRAYAGDVYNMGVNKLTNAYNMYGQPLMTAIGATSPGGLIGMSSGASGGLGAKFLQPESQMSADVNSANAQNAMSTRLGNLQAQTGWSSGMMSMFGSIGGAVLGGPGTGYWKKDWSSNGGGGGGGGGSPA